MSIIYVMGQNTYTPESLRAMADQHDAYSACTMPARDHFAEICRAYADLIESR